LDCGGKTVEEALLRLARIVEYYYNEDGSAKDVPVPCQWIYSSEEDEVENPCEPDEEGFCKKCGYLISDYVDDSEPDESEETQE
jgi:hypothetical protein